MTSNILPRTITDLHNELYQYVQIIPNGVAVMNDIIYDTFKKKRLELLRNEQVEILIQKMKEHYERNKTKALSSQGV